MEATVTAQSVSVRGHALFCVESKLALTVCQTNSSYLTRRWNRNWYRQQRHESCQRRCTLGVSFGRNAGIFLDFATLVDGAPALPVLP